MSSKWTRENGARFGEANGREARPDYQRRIKINSNQSFKL